MSLTHIGSFMPTVTLLGTAQDGGRPQPGCQRPCCADLGAADVRHPVSLGITDEHGRGHLIEATRAMGEQLKMWGHPPLQSVLLTHAHFGHVDGLGHVVAVEQQSASWALRLRWQDPAFGRYICEKASIAVDGISLTVAGCSADGAEFWIAVIPHTWSSTTLQHLKRGTPVNLEADLLAKYTERLLQHGASGSGPSTAPISDAWLKEHGWS